MTITLPRKIRSSSWSLWNKVRPETLKREKGKSYQKNDLREQPRLIPLHSRNTFDWTKGRSLSIPKRKNPDESNDTDERYTENDDAVFLFHESRSHAYPIKNKQTHTHTLCTIKMSPARHRQFVDITSKIKLYVRPKIANGLDISAIISEKRI